MTSHSQENINQKLPTAPSARYHRFEQDKLASSPLQAAVKASKSKIHNGKQ